MTTAPLIEIGDDPVQIEPVSGSFTGRRNIASILLHCTWQGEAQFREHNSIGFMNQSPWSVGNASPSFRSGPQRKMDKRTNSVAAFIGGEVIGCGKVCGWIVALLPTCLDIVLQESACVTLELRELSAIKLCLK
ncbi:hypothetical protein A3731_41115 [Roseovarius sp. HI0049]|nr:hypothetical protein A3731_41115 [Roseovarius sp. HI0049]